MVYDDHPFIVLTETKFRLTRVQEREEQGKPSKDARRGRCHLLESGFLPLWMTPLLRNYVAQAQAQAPIRNVARSDRS